MKPVFADSESMKQKARASLIRPQFQVSDLYHKTGWARHVATHWLFENLTLVVIFLNAIWIAIDADLNPALSLFDSPWPFILGENVFCLFFSLELLIRFLAFKRKRDTIKDKWFIFDSMLVALMVVETWVLSFVVHFLSRGTASSSISNMSMLRMVRMVKLLRISRLTRLLRGLPEVFILMKGVRAALRSVMLFFLTWTFIIYVYALVFRMMNDTVSPGATNFFGSVPGVMNLLLLNGVLPMHATFVTEVAAESWVYWPLTISFIALSFVLLMNMLIGVMVETVTAIASAERESITVVGLASDLRMCMVSLGIDATRGLSKDDVETVILDPEVGVVVGQAGADIVTLADMLQVIFEDLGDENGNITFSDFVESILNMRESNPAKVKDVMGQLRSIKVALKHTEDAIRQNLADDFQELKHAIVELQGAVHMQQDDTSTVISVDELRERGTQRHFSWNSAGASGFG